MTLSSIYLDDVLRDSNYLISKLLDLFDATDFVSDFVLGMS